MENGCRLSGCGSGVRSCQEPGTIKSMVESKKEVRNPGRPTEVQVYVDTSGQMKGWTSNQEAQMVTKKVPDV